MQSNFLINIAPTIYVCTYIYLSNYPSLELSILLSIYLSIYTSIYLSICLSIHPTLICVRGITRIASAWYQEGDGFDPLSKPRHI